jgi:S-adenosylmethionine decarboxylase
MANKIHGLHLLVDGEVQDPVVFSEHNLNELIIQLADALKMTIIMGPLFQKVEIDPSKLSGDVFQDEGGISGYCMISTSHISIHVWPLRRVFLLDVFSCKEFDRDLAASIIKAKLEPVHLRIQSAIRTADFSNV